MKATIVDLRYHMKDVLSALDRGETVIVLHRGKEKAKLTPISPPTGAGDERSATMDQPLFGLWSDRKDLADPDLYVRKLRQNRTNSPQPEGMRPARKRRK